MTHTKHKKKTKIWFENNARTHTHTHTTNTGKRKPNNLINSMMDLNLENTNHQNNVGNQERPSNSDNDGTNQTEEKNGFMDENAANHKR